MLTCATLPELLRDRVAGFKPVYEEHLRDYDEVLPHVLLGELVRFIRTRLKEDGPQSHDAREAMLLLEAAMASPDPKLSELVSVSFLENLDGDDLNLMKGMMGPRLLAELAKGGGQS
jgi:hypothetical protein